MKNDQNWKHRANGLVATSAYSRNLIEDRERKIGYAGLDYVHRLGNIHNADLVSLIYDSRRDPAPVSGTW